MGSKAPVRNRGGFCYGAQALMKLAGRLFATASAAALALALLVAPATAAEAPSTGGETEDLIKRGNDLRRVGDDQNALPLLAKAYERQPTPRNAVQLGLVEQALGRWADSDLHLTEAMKAKQDPWIVRNRAPIEDALNRAKSHVGRVEITGEPAGAEVLVGGRSVGQVPLAEPVRVSAGTVDVELRAVGYRSALRSVRIEGGQYQPVVIRLERGSGATIVNSDTPLPGSAMPTDAGLQTSAAPPSPVRLWAERGAWAGTALALGFGTYELLAHNRDVKTFNDRGCYESDRGPYLINGNGGSDDVPCRSLADSYDTSRKLAFTGFIAAGAFAATGVVLHLLAPDEAPQQARVATCAPRVDGVGVICAATF
jgi:hypothetical protein